MNRPEMFVARFTRSSEASQLFERFAFDAQRDEDRTELELRHAAFQHRAEKRLRVFARKVARRMPAAADLLDDTREIEFAHCSPCRIRPPARGGGNAREIL